MIRYVIWSAPTVLLTLVVVYKIVSDTPPGWWSVLLAFAAGVNTAVLFQLMKKED